MTIEEFFGGKPQARALFDRIEALVREAGGATLRISKSQVAFRRRTTFAAVWIPGQYLRGPHAPLVLTLFFRHREPSARWKEVVEVKPDRVTHHLELWRPEDIDGEVRRLILKALEAAA